MIYDNKNQVYCIIFYETLKVVKYKYILVMATQTN